MMGCRIAVEHDRFLKVRSLENQLEKSAYIPYARAVLTGDEAMGYVNVVGAKGIEGLTTRTALVFVYGTGPRSLVMFCCGRAEQTRIFAKLLRKVLYSSPPSALELRLMAMRVQAYLRFIPVRVARKRPRIHR